jgi:hypothetical protein
MQFSRILSAALVVGAASISFQPAMAAPLTVNRSLATSAVTPQTVRWRHGWHHGWHHHGWHRGWRHHGWRRGYYGPGAVVGGLAAGAIIGGAIANSEARAANNDAYCSSRFKSYDPSSGTYLGYDGDRHPCP